MSWKLKNSKIAWGQKKKNQSGNWSIKLFPGQQSKTVE